MYYKLPIKDRMDLMKSYKKANPKMSYNDMVNDYNDSYQKFGDGGRKDNTNVVINNGLPVKSIEAIKAETLKEKAQKVKSDAYYKDLRKELDSIQTEIPKLGLNPFQFDKMQQRAGEIFKTLGEKKPELVKKEIDNGQKAGKIVIASSKYLFPPIAPLTNAVEGGLSVYDYVKNPDTHNTASLMTEAAPFINNKYSKAYQLMGDYLTGQEAGMFPKDKHKYGGIHKFEDGGIEKEVRPTADNTNVARSYFPNPDNTNMDTRRIPQSGMVVDKRTNQAYYFGDDGDTGTFPVLTAKNPEANKNTYSLSQLAKNPNLRSTPKGYYMVEKESKYKSKDDMQHYKGLMRSLNPIEAYGESKPSASDLALHLTFTDPGNPKVFKNRKHLYNQVPEKRYASYGCVNCQEPSYRAFNKAVPESDTLMMLDSKDPKDLRLLKQAQSRIKTKIKD
jgi:hypothetical protein